MNNPKTALSGIQASKILNITPPEVYFASGSDFPNPEISSIYRHNKDNEIIFNEDWINRSNDLETLVTAFHETRHAYRYHCIKTKSIADIETINRSHLTDSYGVVSGCNYFL